MPWTKTDQRNLKKWKKQRAKPVLPKFQWTHQKEQAALLFGTDRDITIAAAAAQCGVSPRAIDLWKARPEFKARIEEHFSAWKARVREKGIALKETRLLSYLEAHEAIETIRRERAAMYGPQVAKDPDGQIIFDPLTNKPLILPGLPGGTTGFVVLEKRTVAGVSVDHHVYDRALAAEARENKKQLAIELGEYESKLQVTGPDGGPIEMQLTGPDGNPIRSLGPEVLIELLATLRARAAGMQPAIDVTPQLSDNKTT